MSDGEDLGGFTVGTREIYDALVSIKGDVRSLVESDIRVLEKIADHEDRLRALEKWRYSVPAALVTGLLGAAGTVFAAMKALSLL